MWTTKNSIHNLLVIEIAVLHIVAACRKLRPRKKQDRRKRPLRAHKPNGIWFCSIMWVSRWHWPLYSIKNQLRSLFRLIHHKASCRINNNKSLKNSSPFPHALYNTLKFQNFDLKLRRILPHCLKVMAPLPKILKIEQLFEKNIKSKVVDYHLRMFAVYKHGSKDLQK